jgi:predicted lactoylglutathione lyase
MARQMYVNLPVSNLVASKAFFETLDFSFEPNFTNEQAACMIIGEDSFVMLLDEKFFKTFTNKPIIDAKQGTEVLVCLSCDSRQHVDDMVAKAVSVGASVPRPKQDHGFMYGHAFEDLDGHIWELMYMEPAA